LQYFFCNGGAVQLFESNLKDSKFYQDEIKSSLKSGNASYYSEQKILSSSLLSKNIKIKIYRTIILPVVLYGCEIWSLTLWKQYKVKQFDRRVPVKDCGSGEEEDEKVTRQWRELQDEELYDLYSSSNFIPDMKSRRIR
jgi:hypothetical protein